MYILSNPVKLTKSQANWMVKAPAMICQPMYAYLFLVVVKFIRSTAWCVFKVFIFLFDAVLFKYVANYLHVICKNYIHTQKNVEKYVHFIFLLFKLRRLKLRMMPEERSIWFHLLRKWPLNEFEAWDECLWSNDEMVESHQDLEFDFRRSNLR